MKKTAAIFLLLVFLFNLFGYQLLIASLTNKADKKLEALIDYNEYNEHELLEIRVPLNMPYQQRYTDYERHYGQVTINKTIYTYVKRKVEGDVLVLKCIPNISKTQLTDACNNYTATSNGVNPTDSKQLPGKAQVKKVSFDYESETYFPESVSKQGTSNQYDDYYTGSIPDILLPIRIQPPSALLYC